MATRPMDQSRPAPEALAGEPKKMQLGMVGLILMSTLLGVIGQTVLKVGMTHLGPQSIGADGVLTILMRIAFSPYVIGGLALYVSGTFFWLVAMSRVDLSYLYPFASLSYVLLMGVAWVVFREHISPMRLLGALIIVAGVVLVARSGA